MIAKHLLIYMSVVFSNKQKSAHGDSMKSGKIWIRQIQPLVARFI
jgi:hypothetical protein